MYPRSITSVMVAAVLVVSAVAQSSTSAQAESSSTTRGTATAEITPGPNGEMSRDCLSEVMSKVFIDKQDPRGALGDFVSSSKLYDSVNIPTSECDLLKKIPATLHEEYFTFESSRSDWWKSHRYDPYPAWAMVPGVIYQK
ncbi:hypothetical protein PG985_009686 [Apiospora marii]|uniref:uncharacterized protein n=1 Tax=Apiospora marii TaxID=335849 RepID=UPI00312EDB7D